VHWHKSAVTADLTASQRGGRGVGASPSTTWSRADKELETAGFQILYILVTSTLKAVQHKLRTEVSFTAVC